MTLVLTTDVPRPPPTGWEPDQILFHWQTRFAPWSDRMPPTMDWSHCAVIGQLVASLLRGDWDGEAALADPRTVVDCLYYDLPRDAWLAEVRLWMTHLPEASYYWSADQIAMAIEVPDGPRYRLIYVPYSQSLRQLLAVQPMTHQRIAYTGDSLVTSGLLEEHHLSETYIAFSRVALSDVQRALEGGWSVSFDPATGVLDRPGVPDRWLLEAWSSPPRPLEVRWTRWPTERLRWPYPPPAHLTFQEVGNAIGLRLFHLRRMRALTEAWPAPLPARPTVTRGCQRGVTYRRLPRQ